MDLISVIVPVYNVEKLIEKCVKSITDQTYSNLEIILIDDGSVDQSGKICDELALKDNRIVVIHSPNKGAAAARNLGISRARGQYIGFVDSDDYVDVQMYELLLKAIKKYEADIACVGIIREDSGRMNQHIIRCPSDITIFFGKEILREILLGRYIGSSLCSNLYKRKTWGNVTLHEGEINEDIKIMVDLYDKKKMVHIAQPMYHYVCNPKSVTNTLSENDLTISYNNAMNLYEIVKSKYPDLEYDARYYLTYTAKCILMDDSINRKSELYKTCKNIFYRNWKIFGLDWRAILLRINLYHLCKKIVRS